jgi:PAS domain S-box-containing protein
MVPKATYKKLEQRIGELDKNLAEREKELNCLYGLARITEEHGLSLNEALRKVSVLLADSWQYPEIACAYVIFGDSEFATKNCEVITKWGQAADIVVNGSKAGMIGIYYLEEKPALYESPFLKEERKLLNAIAERLARFIEKKQLEEESKHQWEQFAAIIDNFADSLYISDPRTYEVLLVNKSLENALGRNPVGGLCYREFQGRDTPCDFCTNDIILKNRKPYVWEHYNPLLGKDLLLTDQIIRWPDGREVRYEIGIDITERKQMEKRLRTTNEVLERIFSITHLLVAYMDRDFNFIRVNHAYAAVNGWDESSFTGKNHFALYPNPENQAIFQRVVETGEPYSVTAKAFKYPGQPERDMTYWDWTLHPVKNTTGAVEGVLLCLFDVTESEKMKVELRETKTFLEMTLSSLADAVFVVDPQTRTITSCNPAVENIFGYSQEEVIGRNTEFLHVNREMYEEFGRRLFAAIDATGVFRTDYQMMRKDGGVFYTQNTVTEMLDESGNRSGVVSVVRDVTREVRLERELRQSQKMEALGTLAGGIAHDFNNILMPITLNTELALRSAGKPDKVSENLQYVLEAAQRGRELVKQIITFSRRKEQKRETVGIAPVVEEALKLLKASLPSTIEIRGNIGDGRSESILADPTQIHQVLMNLCTNAAHAMRKSGGVLEVSLASVDVDQNAASLHADLKPGPYVRLTVSDTGEGMARETTERIFEPFFTTKERGEGTGMGLAVVHGIVKNHGGAITVYSEKGKGATFNVFFPRVKGESATEALPPMDVLTGTERILLVDDEAPVLRSERAMLEGLGYKITAVAGSEEALKLFREQPDKFDLVITDETMPALTGLELSRQLLRIRGDIPIILCTGFSKTVDEDKARAEGIRELVMKPFTTSEMAGNIRRVLDA